QVGEDERRDAAVDGAQRDLRRQAVQDEDDDADRRDDHAELDHHHVDDPPPDRVVAELLDDRQHEGQRDQHRRDLVEHGAQNEIRDQQRKDDDYGGNRQAADQADQRLGHPRDGHVVGEDRGADDDDVDHGGGDRKSTRLNSSHSQIS